MTQTMTEAVPAAATAGAGGWWSRRPWLHIFLGGLGLWVATVAVTFATSNVNLVPTIILLGSFLVPVAFVAYAFGHADEVVTAQRIFAAFLQRGAGRTPRPPADPPRAGQAAPVDRGRAHSGPCGPLAGPARPLGWPASEPVRPAPGRGGPQPPRDRAPTQPAKQAA